MKPELTEKQKIKLEKVRELAEKMKAELKRVYRGKFRTPFLTEKGTKNKPIVILEDDLFIMTFGLEEMVVKSKDKNPFYD